MTDDTDSNDRLPEEQLSAQTVKLAGASYCKMASKRSRNAGEESIVTRPFTVNNVLPCSTVTAMLNGSTLDFSAGRSGWNRGFNSGFLAVRIRLNLDGFAGRGSYLETPPISPFYRDSIVIAPRGSRTEFL
jgi:hypothetical protein